MKLLRGSQSKLYFAAGSVATIGNFDGVHLGHQTLLAQLGEQAKKRGLPLVVVIFEPQPSEYFLHQDAPARLTTLREKMALLKKCQVDYVFCLHFNQKLAAMTPAEFIDQYFFSMLNVNYLLVGEDFRFGRNRQGDVNLLKQIATARHCEVQTFADYNVNDARVSSTQIRQMLAQGLLAEVAKFLGRSYSLCGRVCRGDGRGRQWGIPTANLKTGRKNIPLTGVYCVQVKRRNGQMINGVANLGNRPTVDGKKLVLEVHLFDFDESIYGELLQVVFLSKLRNEVRFSSVQELIDQIHKDISEAKSRFETLRHLEHSERPPAMKGDPSHRSG